MSKLSKLCDFRESHASLLFYFNFVDLSAEPKCLISEKIRCRLLNSSPLEGFFPSRSSGLEEVSPPRRSW